jgi:hypothetical protein
MNEHWSLLRSFVEGSSNLKSGDHSMGEIIQFPNIEERESKKAVDDAITLFKVQGWPPEAAEWIMNDIKPRLAEIKETPDLTMTLPEEFKGVGEKVAEFVKELQSRFLQQLVLLEVELWAAKYGSGHTL